MEAENATISGAQEGVVASPAEGTDIPANPTANSRNDGQPGVVAPETAEAEAPPQEPEAQEKQEEQEPQPRSINEQARLARLQAAREGRREADAAVAQLGLRNPETGAEIRTLEELHQVATAAKAQRMGVPPETLTQLQELEAENQRLTASLNELRQRENEAKRAEHLAAIKKAYPDVKAESVLDLGMDFIRLMALSGGGLDPVLAYGVIDAQRKSKQKPAPPAIGPLSGVSKPEGGEYFTSDELDALTPADLKDEATYQKAIRSYERLNKKE